MLKSNDIDAKTEITSIAITTLSGILVVYNENVMSTNINVSQLPKGLFLVNIVKTGEVKTSRLMKN
jgi:hypothetical protein